MKSNTVMLPCTSGPQTFSVNCQIINILGFVAKMFSYCSVPWSAFGYFVFNFYHSDRCVVLLLYGFNLNFLNKSCWTSSYTLVCCLCVFLDEGSVLIYCPFISLFLYWLFTSLYILKTTPLLNIWFQVCFLSVVCLFIVLNCIL